MSVRERVSSWPNWIKTTITLMTLVTPLVIVSANWVKNEVERSSKDTIAAMVQKMYQSMPSKQQFDLRIDALTQAIQTDRAEHAEQRRKVDQDHDWVIRLNTIQECRANPKACN